MSSTALSVHSHLPPTSNVLSSQQRMRLLRSTRKLGAVLGTTPYLLENDISFATLPIGKSTSRASRRQGSIFIRKRPSSISVTSASTTSSQPSPATSLVDLSQIVLAATPSTEPGVTNPPGLSCTQKHRPPQLRLQLGSVPVSPIDDRFLAPHTPPTTPLPSPCSSPATPTTPVPNPIEMRRKRVAKLARHLGEKIPVELVDPEPAQKPTPASRDRLRKRRSRSVHVLCDDAVGLHSHATQSNSKQDWVGEWNRSNIHDVQKELRNLRFR